VTRVARTKARTVKAKSAGVRPVRALAARDVAALRRELKKRARPETPRFHADPEDVQRSVARLVLALVEFVRKLLERQAVRRMEARALRPAELERMGRALMQLEATVHDIAARFGLKPEDLNLELGPLGKLS
jgi:hypothetical protein